MLPPWGKGPGELTCTPSGWEMTPGRRNDLGWPAWYHIASWKGVEYSGQAPYAHEADSRQDF